MFHVKHFDVYLSILFDKYYKLWYYVDNERGMKYMKYEMLIEIIKNRIKELEQTKDIWLVELDKNESELANERLNMIYYQIQELKHILERANEL